MYVKERDFRFPKFILKSHFFGCICCIFINEVICFLIRRERIIQLLALRPMNKLQLLGRIRAGK